MFSKVPARRELTRGPTNSPARKRCRVSRPPWLRCWATHRRASGKFGVAAPRPAGGPRRPVSSVGTDGSRRVARHTAHMLDVMPAQRRAGFDHDALFGRVRAEDMRFLQGFARENHSMQTASDAQPAPASTEGRSLICIFMQFFAGKTSLPVRIVARPKKRPAAPRE